MASINFHRTYFLNKEFESIKQRAFRMLEKYIQNPRLINFNDEERSVTFSSERLIPVNDSNRPRVMLLFSNPHPLSILQGMFLSPNSNGQENLFWQSMDDAKWFSLDNDDHSPETRAKIFFKAEHQGPFDLIFYCFYAFPTNYPDDIRKVFGNDYFYKVIEPEALQELRKTIQESSVEAVVAFNKGVFNRVAECRIERYIARLKKGELVESRVSETNQHIPIYLTYPTGWRYHKEYRQLRCENLYAIRTAIYKRTSML